MGIAGEQLLDRLVRQELEPQGPRVPLDLEPDRCRRQLDQHLGAGLAHGPRQPPANDTEDGTDEAVDQRVDRGLVVVAELQREDGDGRLDQLDDPVGDDRDALVEGVAAARLGRDRHVVQRRMGIGPADVGGDGALDDLRDGALEGQDRKQVRPHVVEDPGADLPVELGPVGEVAVDDRATDAGALGDVGDVDLVTRRRGLDDVDRGGQDRGPTLDIVLLPADLAAICGLDAHRPSAPRLHGLAEPTRRGGAEFVERHDLGARPSGGRAPAPFLAVDGPPAVQSDGPDTPLCEQVFDAGLRPCPEPGVEVVEELLDRLLRAGLVGADEPGRVRA